MKNIREEVFRYLQLGLFAAIWAGVIAVTHTHLAIDWEAVASLPHAITIYAIVYLVFVKWGWRLKIFHPWLIPFPDLQGTWDGEVRSTWIDPKTGKGIAPIPSKLIIRQTLSAISCAMVTGESQSYSMTAQINEDDDARVLQLSYAYTNRPRARVRFRSEIHDGAAILTIKEEPYLALEGDYWTSRKTTGEMTFKRVSPIVSIPVVKDLSHPVTENSQ